MNLESFAAMIPFNSFVLFAQESKPPSSVETIIGITAIVIYIFMAVIALWGAYCSFMAWARVKQKRFRSEDAQLEFLQAVADPLSRGDFDSAAMVCEGDPRAMCQLAHIAIVNRNIGFVKVRQLVLDRFRRDVLADLEHRLAWVNTVIKSAPMVGLLGTVLGMMGTFAQMSEDVDPAAMASNIMMALITTACGLAIAIPLVLCTASINVRIRKLEDLVAAGLTHFLDTFRVVLERKRA